MTTADYVHILKRWGWLLVVGALIGALTAYFLSGLATPMYRSSALLLVSQPQQAPATARADLEASALLASTFSQLITTRPITERAAAEIGLRPEEIERSLEVQHVERTQLVEIAASTSSAARSKQIVDAVARVFIASPEAGLARGALQLTLVSPPLEPANALGDRRTLNTALGGFLAFMAAAFVVAVYVRLHPPSDGEGIESGEDSPSPAPRVSYRNPVPSYREASRRSSPAGRSPR
jgi:uncharacterized protein involved in exopolysaccharide biosynthesis